MRKKQLSKPGVILAIFAALITPIKPFQPTIK